MRLHHVLDVERLFGEQPPGTTHLPHRLRRVQELPNGIGQRLGVARGHQQPGGSGEYRIAAKSEDEDEDGEVPPPTRLTDA